jgi:hypothetical protein
MNELLKRIRRLGSNAIGRLESPTDRAFLVDEVPMTHFLRPKDLLSYLGSIGGRRPRVLEIGSREVTGLSTARQDYADADYVGFDYYPGRNVDVDGDVHRLSSYFQPEEKFDLVFSFASFEHFAMPWVVALEIAKMMNIGGILYIRTHFSFGAHERPWNFFQFSDMGLRVLFSSALGFQCLEAGMSNPIVGRFSGLAEKSLRYQPVWGLYCGSEYLGRKVRDVHSFDWNQVTVEEVVEGTKYRAPSL